MELEKTVLGAVDYVIFTLMLLISASIGIYFRFAGGKQKTADEYLLAGKDMSIWPVGFSIMATFLSAITVIGTPGEMYKFGIHFAYINIGFIVGTFSAAYLFLPVFFDLQASTAYEYLQRRFGKITRMLTSFAFVCQMILYMSVVLYAPALALSAVTNLSTWISVVTIGVVCTFYCTLGGMKAVLWTDLFQAILMYLGLLAVLIKGSINVGGVDKVFQLASEGGRIVVPGWEFDFTTRYTMWNLILSGLVLSWASFGGNQVQIQRCLTVKNINKARQAVFLSIPLGAVFHLLNCFAGIVIFANFFKCDPMTSPEKPITQADQLMPYFMMVALSKYPGLPGLCICGIFSASLSTVSSAVNSLSAVTMEDFVRPIFKSRGLTQKKTAFLAQAITLIYGCLCIALTFLVAKFGNLIQASLIVFGMLGGPVFGVFTLGMMTTRTNEKGAIFGLITAIAFCTWTGFGSSYYGPRATTLPVSTEFCLENVLFGNSSDIMEHAGLNASLPTFSTTVSNTEFASLPSGNEAEEYILPVYKISYIWVTPMGFFVCIFVGYLSSLIINCLIEGDNKIVPLELLSPAVRWMEKSREKCERKEKYNMDLPERISTHSIGNAGEKDENGIIIEKIRL